MSPRRPRTARGEATRQKLLDAAEALFGRNGFHATSITEVTRRAGVAQGTFYLYFENKEAIYIELVRHLSHSLRQAIAKDVAGLDDRLEVEEAGLRSFLRFAAAHRDLYRIVYESQYIDRDLFRWYYERLAEAWAEGLSSAMEAGQIRRLEPEAVAYALMGTAHFMGMRWVLWENEEPPEEVLGTVRQLIHHGLAPDGE